MTPNKADARAPAAGAARQYLTFRLAGEEYGVDILRVQEIKGWERATRIPHAPSYMLGVTNLRGSIVPIIDLRRRFGLTVAEFGATTVVIVVRVAGENTERTVGVVVDAVCDVYSVADAAVQPAPEIGAGADSAFVKGLATIDGKMLILLDLDLLINASVFDALGASAA